MTMRPGIPSTARGTAGDTADVTVVRVGTLDGWLSHTWDDGVQVDHLPDLHALRVETFNSTYDVAIVSGARGEVLVRGGRYFPEWTSATFLGCSMGGGLLKRHGIHIGLRLEFYCGGRRIVTSPICAIGRGEDARSA